MDDFTGDFKLLDRADERHHYFRDNLKALFFQFACSFDNCPHLHDCNFRMQDTEPAATKAKHGVEFVQIVNSSLYLFKGSSHFSGKNFDFAVGVRQELMQRRIKKSDGNRSSAHCFEETVEVFTLVWNQLLKRYFASFNIVGQNHFAHGINTLATEEHVFCTAEADTFGTESDGNFCLVRLIGIGADLEFTVLVGPLHELFVNRPRRCIFRLEGFVNQNFNDFRVFGRNFSGDHFTGASVDGDVITF